MLAPVTSADLSVQIPLILFPLPVLDLAAGSCSSVALPHPDVRRSGRHLPARGVHLPAEPPCWAFPACSAHLPAAQPPRPPPPPAARPRRPEPPARTACPASVPAASPSLSLADSLRPADSLRLAAPPSRCPCRRPDHPRHPPTRCARCVISTTRQLYGGGAEDGRWQQRAPDVTRRVRVPSPALLRPAPRPDPYPQVRAAKRARGADIGGVATGSAGLPGGQPRALSIFS